MVRRSAEGPPTLETLARAKLAGSFKPAKGAKSKTGKSVYDALDSSNLSLRKRLTSFFSVKDLRDLDGIKEVVRKSKELVDESLRESFKAHRVKANKTARDLRKEFPASPIRVTSNGAVQVFDPLTGRIVKQVSSAFKDPKTGRFAKFSTKQVISREVVDAEAFKKSLHDLRDKVGAQFFKDDPGVTKRRSAAIQETMVARLQGDGVKGIRSADL